MDFFSAPKRFVPGIRSRMAGRTPGVSSHRLSRSAPFQCRLSADDLWRRCEGRSGHHRTRYGGYAGEHLCAHIQKSSRVELGKKFEEGFYAKRESPSPQAVPAAGEPTISTTALLELLKNADPEIKAQLRLALLTCKIYHAFQSNSSPCRGFPRKRRPCKNRALTVQTPNFRGYITKKNAKSYDLTFNIWCTSRDSNPGPTD